MNGVLCTGHSEGFRPESAIGCRTESVRLPLVIGDKKGSTRGKRIAVVFKRAIRAERGEGGLDIVIVG